jgi:hypothetical protein
MAERTGNKKRNKESTPEGEGSRAMSRGGEDRRHQMPGRGGKKRKPGVAVTVGKQKDWPDNKRSDEKNGARSNRQAAGEEKRAREKTPDAGERWREKGARMELGA